MAVIHDRRVSDAYRRRACLVERRGSVIAEASTWGKAKGPNVADGDQVIARKAYQDFLYFLSLWKTADPDIPILTEAQAEYAKLR